MKSYEVSPSITVYDEEDSVSLQRTKAIDGSLVEMYLADQNIPKLIAALAQILVDRAAAQAEE